MAMLILLQLFVLMRLFISVEFYLVLEVIMLVILLPVNLDSLKFDFL